MTAQTATIADFLLARIAEDEALAKAAIDPDRPGTHWQWVSSDTDAPVETPTWEDNPSLRTVEEYPTQSVGDLPAFVINHAEADEPRALPHIARHDPARVLAECEAKRRIVELMSDEVEYVVYSDDVLRALALPYADHPDFNPDWRV